MSESAPGLAHLTCVILAGGLGTRLRSIIGQQQKVLTEVNGRPFLTYLLDQLSAANASRVVLCTGYQSARIPQVLGAQYANLELHYSPEETPLGTGGALRLALPLIKSPHVLVMNGDSFCGVDLAAFTAWHHARANAATLVITHMDNTLGFGRVQVSEDSVRITAPVEKASAAEPGWVNAGIYLIKTTCIEDIPADRSVSLEHEIFPRWIEQGMFAYRAAAPLIDIGTPESYVEASQFFASW